MDKSIKGEIGKSCWQAPFECHRSQLGTCVCKVALCHSWGRAHWPSNSFHCPTHQLCFFLLDCVYIYLSVHQVSFPSSWPLFFSDDELYLYKFYTYPWRPTHWLSDCHFRIWTQTATKILYHDHNYFKNCDVKSILHSYKMIFKFSFIFLPLSSL